TLIKSIPTMLESFRMSLQQLTSRGEEDSERTQQDLAFPIVITVAAAVLLVLIFVPGILGYIDSVPARALAAILVAVFAFFFVTVSSRIVGLVGQTSNPISGMTIASLLGTSLIFYMLGWTDDIGRATALMVGTAICIAASIAGDTSQDLKTGFILGATPRIQQIGELIGCITSAGVVCWVLMLLDKNIGLGSEDLPAPQATLMKLVIEGVLDQNLPWGLLGIGVVIALIVAALRLPVLAFAVGVYLPLETMAPIFLGGILRWFITRTGDEKVDESRRERGVLFSSGLVGGAGLTGVFLALAVTWNEGKRLVGLSEWLNSLPELTQQLMALAATAVILGILAIWSMKKGEE
ncbi:MAG: OPT/YSL family transporter, partial [Planctomycetota bacterium]